MDRPWLAACVIVAGLLIALAAWAPVLSWSAGLLWIGVITTRAAWSRPLVLVVLTLWTMVAPTLYLTTIAGFGLAPYVLFEIVALLGWLRHLSSNRIALPTGFRFLAVYIVLTTASVALSSNLVASLTFLARLWLSWLVVFLLLAFVTDRRRLFQVIVALLVQAAVVMVMSLGPLLPSIGLPEITSILAPHFQKNDYATYLCFAGALAFAAYAARGSRPSVKTLALVVMMLIGLCWPLTYSRSGGLAILTCIIAMSLLNRTARTFRVLTVGGALAGIALAALPAEIRQTSLFAIGSIVSPDPNAPTSFAETIDQRMTLNYAGLETITRRPVLGLGLGEWANQSPVQLTLWNLNREEVVVVGANLHNRFLLIAAESGIFALAAYLGFLASLLWAAIRVRRQADQQMRLLLDALIASTFGFLVAMCFIPGSLWEWNLLALLAVAERVASREIATRAVPARATVGVAAPPVQRRLAPVLVGR